MKIAYIHQETKRGTGASQINSLIVNKLRQKGVLIKSIYPKYSLIDPPLEMKGLSNILFFYSLLEKRRSVLNYDLIQGTTYTPLAFLLFSKPVISHFGSTSYGFLENTPLARNMDPELRKIWVKLRRDEVIKEVNLKSRRPIIDIAEIEIYVAKKVNMVIATSIKVKNELVARGVKEANVEVIHNAIEDYWFDSKVEFTGSPKLVFLGRLGEDAFTLKLKGFDRLVDIYQSFPEVEKIAVVMTRSERLSEWMTRKIKNLKYVANYPKEKIKDLLYQNGGGILLITSRYEGFSLSLIEGMSQGMVPVAYPVGVVPEVIKDGSNGFIIHNQEEAKARINQLLNDSTLRKRMAMRALKSVNQFRAEIMVRELTKLYKKIIRRKPKKERHQTSK